MKLRYQVFISLSISLSARSAAADGDAPRLPLAQAERPITNPSLVLTPELTLDAVHVPAAAFGASLSFGSTPAYVFVNLGRGPELRHHRQPHGARARSAASRKRAMPQ